MKLITVGTESDAFFAQIGSVSFPSAPPPFGCGCFAAVSGVRQIIRTPAAPELSSC